MRNSFILIMVISMFLCCKKQSESLAAINKSDIIGIWINSTNNKDTLRFSDTQITRWNLEANCDCHHYNYSIKSDSLTLNYSGIDKIAITPYSEKINLSDDKQTLIIQNFHLVHPSYAGDVFIRFKK